jgi:beta-lactamase superfamily II metal-dependent hydrolase
MLFSLDVLRARKGDCLLLHYGSKKRPRLMIIDGGPSTVYGKHLRPRLQQIRKARCLDENDSLRVDVLMVSHIDDDHIKGILDLTRQLKEQRDAQQPRLVKVGSLWHNTFDDLLHTTPEELMGPANFGAAAIGGTVDLPETGAEEEIFDTAKVLASVSQGRDLRDDAGVLGWKVNKEFGGKLIVATDASEAVPLDAGLRITVVGPMQAELKKLQKEHDKWLQKQEEKRRSKEELAALLAAYADRSAPNLSSLVFLLEADGKRLLLTGDARGDKILKGLKTAGFLTGAASSLHVDILKVPHHGSQNNMEKKFFEKVTADHYVFSGDGEHGNPERETLEMLLDARGDAPFTLHFTYPLEEIDAERKGEHNKKAAAGNKWSKGKHSLVGLFEQRPLQAKQQIRIVGPKGGHVIDLADPLKQAWPGLVA